MKTLVALVGTRWRGDDMVALLKSLPQGEPLALIREPTNAVDAAAIQVWARDQHIGFVKGTQNRHLAAKMDRNPDFRAAMSSGLRCKLAIDGGKQPMVEIDG
jgi:hypothetical protein